MNHDLQEAVTQLLDETSFFFSFSSNKSWKLENLWRKAEAKLQMCPATIWQSGWCCVLMHTWCEQSHTCEVCHTCFLKCVLSFTCSGVWSSFSSLLLGSLWPDMMLISDQQAPSWGAARSVCVRYEEAVCECGVFWCSITQPPEVITSCCRWSRQ